MRVLSLVWWFLPAVLAMAQTPPAELTPVKQAWERNLAQIRTVREQRAAPIATAYLAALDRLEKQAPSEPAVASAVSGERDRLTAKREPRPGEFKSMPPAVAELANRYEADLARSDAPFVQQEHQQTRQYISILETLQRRLTAQNQVADAAAVRAESLAAAATLPGAALPRPEGVKGTADSTIRASTVKAVGALDAPLARTIAAAAAAKSYTRTEKSSQEDTSKGWVDIPDEGGLLVGFEFFEVGKEKRIRSLRPYFMTSDGIVAGKDRGKMEKVTTKIIARAGFAVAGIITNQTKSGIQVIFMKIDSASGHFATDSASTYKSLWYGDRGREKPIQIGGDGKFVVGVYGKTGSDCDDLGLVEISQAP
jgi:hypothetical protein